ncbi:MAG: hypothetical protein EOO22_08365 [Comamonadaceae bacterium]|nr:MAG: hypothetical protein EOO22_08365 [Comamonadaceae bacterium]
MTKVQFALVAVGLLVVTGTAAVAGRLMRPTPFDLRAFRAALALAGLAAAIGLGVRLVGSSAESRLAEDLARLRSANHFFRGLIGFAGHPAPADLAFERVLAAPDAETSFMELALSPAATPAAKAYAICGLKTLNSARLPETLVHVRRDASEVSTMHGDVMTKRPLAQAIEEVARRGC